MPLLPTYAPQGVDLRNLYFNAPAPPPGLSAPRATLGQKVTEYAEKGLRKVVPKRVAKKVAALVGFSPFGNIVQGFDSGQALRHGDLLGGGIGAALAVLPIPGPKAGKGMFGRATSAAERAKRAEQLGFTIDAYHGTSAGDIDAFDPSKVRDNAQYGGNFYFSPTPDFANKHVDKWGGDAPAVYPVKLRIQKPFKMDEPISAGDAARALEALGQPERAQMIRDSGNGYRTGSEFFYWGMGQQTTVTEKANALRAAGFDGIIGDPQREIIGKPGRPHIMVFEPQQIRSRFAEFDPAKADSPYLSH